MTKHTKHPLKQKLQQSDRSQSKNIEESELVKAAKVSLSVHRCRFIHYLSPAIVSISVSRNGLIAMGRQNGNIEIFASKQSTTFYQTKILAGSPEDGLECVVWVGTRLFSAGLAGEITEWNLTTLRPRYSESSHGGAIWSMKVNPTNDVLAVGCEDGCIRLFRIVEGGCEYLSALERQTTKVISLAWHPRKPIIVVGGTDGKARVVHADTGRTIHTLLMDAIMGEDTVVWDVIVLFDGTIVTADSLGKVSFWHGPTAVMTQQFISHAADVLCLTATADGKRVFSSGVDRVVVEHSKLEHAWVNSGSKRYHSHDVRSLCLLPDKPHDLLISGGVDTTLILSGPAADFNNMRQQRLAMIPHAAPICLAPQRRLLSCMFGDQIRVWGLSKLFEVENMHDRQRLENQAHKHLLTISFKGECNLIAHSMSSDGNYVATCDNSTVRLFQIDVDSTPLSISVLQSKDLETLKGASQLQFTPDSTTLVIGGHDGTVTIFDMATLEATASFSTKAAVAVQMLACSADSKWLMSSNVNNQQTSYSLAGLTRHQTLPKYARATSLTFHSHTPELVITTVSNEIFILDVPANTLTPWSHANSYNFPARFTNRTEVIKGITFPTPLKMMVWAGSYTLTIDLTITLDRESKWRTDDRFHSLMFCEVMEGGEGEADQKELVIVERPVLQVLAELPDAFKKKKYGRG